MELNVLKPNSYVLGNTVVKVVTTERKMKKIWNSRQQFNRNLPVRVVSSRDITNVNYKNIIRKTKIHSDWF